MLEASLNQMTFHVTETSMQRPPQIWNGYFLYNVNFWNRYFLYDAPSLVGGAGSGAQLLIVKVELNLYTLSTLGKIEVLTLTCEKKEATFEANQRFHTSKHANGGPVKVLWLQYYLQYFTMNDSER